MLTVAAGGMPAIAAASAGTMTAPAAPIRMILARAATAVAAALTVVTAGTTRGLTEATVETPTMTLDTTGMEQTTMAAGTAAAAGQGMVAEAAAAAAGMVAAAAAAAASATMIIRLVGRASARRGCGFRRVIVILALGRTTACMPIAHAAQQRQHRPCLFNRLQPMEGRTESCYERARRPARRAPPPPPPATPPHHHHHHRPPGIWSSCCLSNQLLGVSLCLPCLSLAGRLRREWLRRRRLWRRLWRRELPPKTPALLVSNVRTTANPPPATALLFVNFCTDAKHLAELQ